jgi:hypothetical protein
MRIRRADVVRGPVAPWFVLALLAGGAPALHVAVAHAAGAGAPSLGDVDLDAPDVGRQPNGKAVVDAGVELPTTPDGGTPTTDAGGAVPPTDAGVVAPSTEPPAPPLPTVVDEDGRALFVVRPWNRAALLDAASAHLRAATPAGASAATDSTRARRTLVELEQALAEAGAHGVPGGTGSPAIGAALAREADALAAAGEKTSALEVADVALRAAPGDTAVATRVAHVRWRTQGVSAAGDVVDVVRLALHDPLRGSDLAVRVVGAFIVVVLALLAAIVLSLAVPAVRMLGFDVWLMLPRGSNRVQGFAVAALLVAAPVVVGAGVVVAGMWAITLALVYLGRPARVWTFIVGVLVAVLPLAVDVLARAAVVAGEDADVIAAALYDVDADDARQTLRAREARGDELPLLARAALASAARREGRIDEAVDRWRALAERSPEQGWVHGGYGVALATAGRDDVALSELRLCVERSIHDADIGAVAAFDASVLLQKMGRGDRAQAMVNGAVPSSAGLMAAMRRATFRNPDEVVVHNRAFVDVLPPRRLLVELARPATPQSAAVVAAIARPLWGTRASGPFASAMLAAFVVVWALLAAFAKRLRPARPCVRCGAPASRRVDARDVPENTCSACFHAFLSKKSRVAPAVKLRREREILLRGRVRSVLVVVLSLWPGVGHLFAGSIARGAALLITSTTAVVGVVGVSELLPGPAPVGPWSAWWLAAPFLFVAAGAFLVSLRGALALADDERVGGVR